MKDLKTVEAVVEKILDENKNTRSSDDLLYLNVCEYFCNGVSSMTLGDFLTTRKETKCPTFESVRRTRQKVFEKRPSLKPPKVTQAREAMIDVFVDYAING